MVSLRYHPSMCLNGLRKGTKDFCQGNRLLVRDSKCSPSEDLPLGQAARRVTLHTPSTVFGNVSCLDMESVTGAVTLLDCLAAGKAIKPAAEMSNAAILPARIKIVCICKRTVAHKK